MPSLVEIGPVVLEKKIFKFRQYILFFIISPWKRAGPSFGQTWFPFTQGCYVPSLVEIGPVVLEKKMKMWKVYRRTDRQTDQHRVHYGNFAVCTLWGKNDWYKKSLWVWILLFVHWVIMQFSCLITVGTTFVSTNCMSVFVSVLWEFLYNQFKLIRFSASIPPPPIKVFQGMVYFVTLCI